MNDAGTSTKTDIDIMLHGAKYPFSTALLISFRAYSQSGSALSAIGWFRLKTLSLVIPYFCQTAPMVW
jgi:hypothetical protein